MIGFATGYDPSASVPEMAELVAAAEGAGFDLALFSETLFSNRDSVSALAGFALRTSSIGLSCVQVTGLRTPLLMAQTVATLDEMSGGRVVLVAGAYTSRHALRNGIDLPDPTGRLREYVEVIRLLLSGDPVSYEGTHIRLRDVALGWRPGRAEVPIWFASSTPAGLRQAAALADGVLLDAVASPEYTARAVRILREAADAAGRNLDSFTVAQIVNTSIEAERSAAFDAVRWEVASKFRFPGTPKSRLLVGEPAIDTDDLPRFTGAYQSGGMSALVEAIPDEYVAALTASGTVDDVRARVEAYRDAGVALPFLRPAAARQIPTTLEVFGRKEAMLH